MRPGLLHPEPVAECGALLHGAVLTEDLGLDLLFEAMGGDDDYLHDAARATLLADPPAALPVIRHRQAVLDDCFRNPEPVMALYDHAVAAATTTRRSYFRLAGRAPGSVLYSATSLLEALLPELRALRDVAERHSGQFRSPGFRSLFEMLRGEFSEDYLRSVALHLAVLRFQDGVLLSAGLAGGNASGDFRLHEPAARRRSWPLAHLRHATPAHSFRIDEQDEAGARALSDLQGNGLRLAAAAAARATEQVAAFFDALRAELAFYVCCLNLRRHLAVLGAPMTMPAPAPPGARALRCTGLYDVALALSLGRRPVGSTVNADGKAVVIITGANQGGKSSFLRAVGLAQLMMQCGMFVGAEQFSSSPASGVFTHFRRGEDVTMRHGMLDEELVRLGETADRIRPGALLLLNESFATTNEREGSVLAGQVVRAMTARQIRVIFVTHLHAFAESLASSPSDDTLFLRAGRRPDGTRTYRMAPGPPEETSHAREVYQEVFPGEPD